MSKKRDVLSLADLSDVEIQDIIKFALELKAKPDGFSFQPLKGKSLAMVFQKPSTRTRLSFEVGMTQLGGNAICLNSTDLQLSRGETIEDTAKTLSLYVNCIMARVYDHSDVKALALHSKVPVINGLSDAFHPCQILADLMTIQECKGRLHGLKVAWVGDGNNVCNDLLIGCAKMAINIAVACPPNYSPLSEALAIAKVESAKNGSLVEVTDNPDAAARNADVLVTDTFVSIGKEEERQARQNAFLPKFQVNKELLKVADSNAIFMHCLPAKRDQEVTADIIDGPNSVVWQEAENRLHAQKALLCFLLNANLPK